MKNSRLFDALCNRIREGLRVLEDQNRFLNDDFLLTSKLKTFRHNFLCIEKDLFKSSLRHRQAQTDVGRHLKNPSSSNRSSTWDICEASWSRIQESLRSLEEATKLEFPKKSSKIEQLRYQTYELQDFSKRNRPRQWKLYALITQELCHFPLKKLIPALVRGGVEAIQLREKKLSDRKILARARLIKSLVGQSPIQLILNDRPDLAIASGFDGVHVGQSDLLPNQIKKIFGNRLFVGLSTHTSKQAAMAQNQGADYIGIGPVFKTQTKSHLRFIGTHEVKKMVKASKLLPHVCIGGLDSDNINQVILAGGRGVALCTGLIQSKFPTKTAKKIKKLFKT